MPPTQTPTQKLKSGFLRFSSQEIGSSLPSLEMIFEALHSDLFKFKFHILSSKILEFKQNIRLKYVFRISSGVQWSINWNTNVKTDKVFVPSSLATVRDVSTAECQSVVKWEWRTNTSIEWDEIEKGTLDIYVLYVHLKYGSNKGHMRLK